MTSSYPTEGLLTIASWMTDWLDAISIKMMYHRKEMTKRQFLSEIFTKYYVNLHKRTRTIILNFFRVGEHFSLNSNDVCSGESDCDDSPMSTDTSEDRSFHHLTLVMWICVFVCTLQSKYALPDTVIETLIYFVQELFVILTQYGAMFASVATSLPTSIYLLRKHIGFTHDNFVKYVVCRKCCVLYQYSDCVAKVEGKLTSKTCHSVAFPHHSQQARQKHCGELLLNSVQLKDGITKLIPFKTHCYKRLTDTMNNFCKRPDFELKCELWRDRNIKDGCYTDVYDGGIWKEFQTEKKKIFLCHRRHYGIMVNLDWFQPYEHVSYSVGSIYEVFFNLPREERYKLKSVILFGLIPDMGTELPVNTFILPLVDKLLEACIMALVWKLRQVR